MEQPTDLDDKEFTELYSRIERTYNIGRIVVVSIGIIVMIYVLQ